MKKIKIINRNSKNKNPSCKISVQRKKHKMLEYFNKFKINKS